jgi:hypothetical protein
LARRWTIFVSVALTSLLGHGASAHEVAHPEHGFHPSRHVELQRPDKDLSQPTAPSIPAKRLSPLRAPRRSTVFWGPLRGNDPTDDGTSDDRDDDDDAWDELNAVEESEASGTAWFEPDVCSLDQLWIEAIPAWNYHPFATSFLSLQKLRC